MKAWAVLVGRVLLVAVAAVCFIVVMRTDYIANCQHTNQGVHLLLDGPIKAGIAANRKILADPLSSPGDRDAAQTRLDASLAFKARVDAIYSSGSCRWPPVAPNPGVLSPASTATTTATRRSSP